MPSLLIFCPCEKVIVSEDDKTTSIITILETVKISPPGDEVLPDDALAPLRWSVFTLWKKGPDDDGVKYEQNVKLFSPNGSVATDGTLLFQFSKARHRNVMNVVGFPVGQTGDCTITLSIRREGEKDWALVAEYTIPVQHEEAN